MEPIPSPDRKPCKRGHLGPRRPSGNCIECEKDRYKNPDRAQYIKQKQAERRTAIKSDPLRYTAHQDYMKRYASNNREALRESSNSRYKQNNIKIRLQRKKIQITSEIIDYIENHNGKCDLCNRLPDGRWKELHIDHCHTSNQFRGMLCGECNTGIGKFQDDPELLRKTANYVEHYR